MRIAFVTQWYPPEPGTGVPAAIARGLAERGHTVDVLTGFPNYPSGRLHDGYSLRPYMREEEGSRLTIHRAPLFPSHDQSAVKRSVNYLSFALSSTLVARKLPRPNVWLVYSSPATAAIPALVAPPRLRASTYLLIEDLWPDSVTTSGFLREPLRSMAERVLNRYCNWTYARADGVGTISPGMRDILASRGVPQPRIHYTPNWFDDSFLRNTSATSNARRRLGLPDGRLFLYAGNMGRLQGLSPLVDVFARDENRHLHLVLLGDGVMRDELAQRIASTGVTNIHLLPPVEPTEVGHYLAASDVQVVSLQDSLLLRATMPSKVQAALASGRAVLANASGDVAELISSNGCGAVCTPGNTAEALAAVNLLGTADEETLRAMGRRARLAFERHFSADACLDRLEAMITSKPRSAVGTDAYDNVQ